MNRPAPDTPATLAGIAAGLTLVGGGQLLILIMRWMTP